MSLAVLILAQGLAHGADKSGTSFRDNFNRLNPSQWYTSNGWANGDWQNCVWSKNAVDIKSGKLILEYEKKDLKSRDYACAEVHTYKKYGYGTYEARFKTDKQSGLNAAFFSYIGESDKQPHDEIDFEVLTKDTSKVSVNTYVNGKPKNGGLVPVPTPTDSQYHTYAFDWEKNRIRWYVDGKLVHTAKGSAADLPSHPQNIFFSLWGTDKLTDWLGPFEDPGRTVKMHIDWVAYTAPGDKCQFKGSVVCKLH